MSCPSESDLLRLVSGELSDGRRAELAAHIEKCPTCARQVAETTALWNAMGAWTVDVAGHGVDRAVLDAVQAMQFQRRRWQRPLAWPVPLRAAASFLLAAGIGWAASQLAPKTPAPDRADLLATAEPVTPEQIAADLSLEALGGANTAGLAATLLDDQQPIFKEHG